MTRIRTSALITLWAMACLCGLNSAARGEPLPAPAEQPTAPTAEDYQQTYRPLAPRVLTPTPAQRKAQARGEQRMARLEALRWYGFSNSRPTASAMPWTTMYSPAWQQPGGRPFAWYTTSRPVTIYVQPREMYR
jgi:hypothetical protein